MVLRVTNQMVTTQGEEVDNTDQNQSKRHRCSKPDPDVPRSEISIVRDRKEI
jgi:hypothetical protein